MKNVEKNLLAFRQEHGENDNEEYKELFQRPDIVNSFLFKKNLKKEIELSEIYV